MSPPMNNNNNNTSNSEQEPVCVGTIIEDNNNNNHHHQHNNDAYAWGSQQHHQHHQHQNHFSQTLPSFQQQQPQHHQHHQHQQQQQQNVVYARNPQTGETVMFPVIPAMFAPPNHHSGSPTYEYHGTTRATLNNTHSNNMNNTNTNNNTHANQTNNNNNNNNNDQHQQQIIIPEPNSKSWSTGLFECFDDSEGLIESWCCGRCQLSRQYGFMQNGTKDIDLFSFFFSVVVDVLAGPTGIVALTWWTRRAIRQRYGIIGNDCSDFFAAACCGPCATHQQYRQMSIENEWPTGCCINQVYSLPASKRHSNNNNMHVHPHEMGQQRQNRSATTQLHQGEVVSDHHTNTEDTSMV